VVFAENCPNQAVKYNYFRPGSFSGAVNLLIVKRYPVFDKGKRSLSPENAFAGFHFVHFT
jgi:hypothetical protein